MYICMRVLIYTHSFWRALVSTYTGTLEIGARSRIEDKTVAKIDLARGSATVSLCDNDRVMLRE